MWNASTGRDAYSAYAHSHAASVSLHHAGSAHRRTYSCALSTCFEVLNGFVSLCFSRMSDVCVEASVYRVNSCVKCRVIMHCMHFAGRANALHAMAKCSAPWKSNCASVVTQTQCPYLTVTHMMTQLWYACVRNVPYGMATFDILGFHARFSTVLGTQWLGRSEGGTLARSRAHHSRGHWLARTSHDYCRNRKRARMSADVSAWSLACKHTQRDSYAFCPVGVREEDLNLRLLCISCAKL